MLRLKTVGRKLLKYQGFLLSLNRNIFSPNLGDSELLKILQESEAELQDNLIKKTSGYSRTSKEYQESETVFKTRMATKEKEFGQQRDSLF